MKRLVEAPCGRPLLTRRNVLRLGPATVASLVTVLFPASTSSGLADWDNDVVDWDDDVDYSPMYKLVVNREREEHERRTPCP